MKINNVAILYIATGPYINFFNDFHLSSERYFLPNCNKEYFLFTDTIVKNDDKNIHVKKIDKSPWPINTLLRFEYFLTVKEELKNFDYIFFFNANALFTSDFTHELLPDGNNDGLIGVIHPGYKNKIFIRKPFEKRKNLTCHLSWIYNGVYAQGCFNGGATNKFLELIETCAKATRNDLKKNLIAKVHDESYLNWYFSKFNPKLLSEDYSWPEVYGYRSKAVIIMRDKEKYDWYKNIKK